MNAKTLIAAVLSAGFAAGAFAQEVTLFADSPASSTLTRAEVKAQAQAADRDVVFAGEATIFPQTTAAAQPRTRAEVRAEAREALLKGETFGGEATLFPQDNFASVRTRDEVRAEAIQHLRSQRSGS